MRAALGRGEKFAYELIVFKLYNIHYLLNHFSLVRTNLFIRTEL